MHRDTIASLWIGDRLSFLELLCLKAFYDIGQKVTLYSYSPIENLPSYVTPADAREIYDPEQILRQKVGGGIVRQSPALHADIFRLHLLKKTEFIWADTDAYPIRTFETQNGYLFGKVGPNILNGVLGLPPESPTLNKLLEFAAKTDEFPPWWDDRMRQAHLDEEIPVGPEYFPWGTYGPQALQYFMNQTGEVHHAAESEVLYPIKARHKKDLLTKSEIEIPSKAVSIHLYSTNLKAVIRRGYDGVLPAGCFLEQMCKKHGINPSNAPI
ncbi:hypothetical protein [Ruegeria arenilitoris]|uniref:hypothetical protein n=1 Tax=Ruegeria arenilitoris TaxID=1173585 RepID=UPI001480771E|nr:hypothetical protein [Ruegeria arenilitoris]